MCLMSYMLVCGFCWLVDFCSIFIVFWRCLFFICLHLFVAFFLKKKKDKELVIKSSFSGSIVSKTQR